MSGMMATGAALPGDHTAESGRGGTALLGTLRPLSIALPLFLYTWLGPLADIPPFSTMAQGLLLAFLSFWWAWRVWRRRGLVQTPLNWPLIAFVASAVLSTVFSSDRRLSADGVLSMLSYVLLFFAIGDLLLYAWPRRVLVNAVLAFATLILLQSVWQITRWYWEWYAIRVPDYPIWPVPLGRLQGVAWNPNLLAAIIYIALPFAITRFHDGRGGAGRAVWGLWLAVADIVLVYTGSRAGWLGACAAAGVMVVWFLLGRGLPRRGHVWQWLRTNARIWSAVAAYSLLFLAVYTLNPRTNPLVDAATTSLYPSVAEAATSGRIGVWSAALRGVALDPVSGSGPWTYHWTYLALSGSLTPQGSVFKHAHNVELNVLAEQGVLGLTALVSLAAVTFRSLIRGLVRCDGNPWSRANSLVVAASFAAVVGLATQSQFDVLTWLPANAILLVMVVAIGLSAAQQLRPPVAPLRRWAALALVVPCVLCPVLVRQNKAHEALVSAYFAWDSGALAVSAQETDDAVAADPGFSFYHEQRGDVYAVLSEVVAGAKAADLREQALLSYARALDLGPAWPPTLLKVAVLEERGGQAGRLEAALEPWIERWGRWPLPHFLLAERYVSSGRDKEAEDLLRGLLERLPGALDMAGCRSSPTCRSVAETLSPPEPASAPWLREAHTWIEERDLERARYSTRVAEAGGASASSVALLRARIYLAEGQIEDATGVLEDLLRPTMRTASYDLIFRRIGLGVQLPSLAMLERTEDHLVAYRLLAQIYDDEGRAQQASAMRDDAARLARLLEMGDEGRLR